MNGKDLYDIHNKIENLHFPDEYVALPFNELVKEIKDYWEDFAIQINLFIKGVK